MADLYFPHAFTLALGIGNLVEVKAGEVLAVNDSLVPSLSRRFGAVAAAQVKGEPPRVNVAKRTLSAEAARLLTPPPVKRPPPAEPLQVQRKA